MVRASLWLFGYRVIRIEEGAEKIPALLLSKKIPFVSPEPGVFWVSEKYFTILEPLLKDRFSYSASECLGLRGRVSRIRCKRGLAIGIFISLILSLLLTNTVWEVNVEGNTSMTDAEIEFMLSECGFGEGDLWPLVNRTEIENEFLLRSKRISWININRRGTVAYVVVSEKTGIADEEENSTPDGYANIVATVGCVIEEITVKRGQAEVKAGDAVKAGDVLISGVLPDEAGGGFCYAEGVVIGRLSDRVVAEVSREHEEIMKKDINPVSCDLKIFNLTINIFKKYRNSSVGCDIIEDVKVFSLFGERSLPISLNTKYALESTKTTANYTDDELVRLASRELSSKTALRLRSSDLLRIKTDGSFTETGYKMYSDIVFLSEVGEAVKFCAD